ncbi:hypothetical protein DFJ73DRAFT_34609 [Zopfochytrium polystomum]|nr:hypothetical protein DFJ73DRAFT_34609 [Zopfochytrium polystomum]
MTLTAALKNWLVSSAVAATGGVMQPTTTRRAPIVAAATRNAWAAPHAPHADAAATGRDLVVVVVDVVMAVVVVVDDGDGRQASGDFAGGGGLWRWWRRRRGKGAGSAWAEPRGGWCGGVRGCAVILSPSLLFFQSINFCCCFARHRLTLFIVLFILSLALSLSLSSLSVSSLCKFWLKFLFGTCVFVLPSSVCLQLDKEGSCSTLICNIFHCTFLLAHLDRPPKKEIS